MLTFAISSLQDYKGQLLCENLYYIIVLLFGVYIHTTPVISLRAVKNIDGMYCLQSVSWIVGYIDDNFYTAVYGWLIGLGLTVIVSLCSLNTSTTSHFSYITLAGNDAKVCIPDWPWYNRNPVQWLPELPDHSAESLKKKAKNGK